MAPPEQGFFTMLERILENRYYVFPQVNLISLLNHKITGQNWKAAKSNIDRLSVDYAIFSKNTFTPILAIELDDSSHEEEDRIKRDLKVEKIFSNAQIPLVRIKYQDRLNEEYVRTEISKYL